MEAKLPSISANLPVISEGDFDYLVNQRTLARGRGYYHQDRVTKLSIETLAEQQWRLTSTVLGSRLYQQEIEIRRSHNPGNPDDVFHEITTSCTCPVYMDCKHCVAVLYTYMEKCEKEPESLGQPALKNATRVESRTPTDYWLEALQERDSQIALSEQREYEIVFLLRKSDYRYNAQFPFEVEFEMARCRRLKKGGLGKTMSIYFHQLMPHYGLGTQLKEHEREIARLIRPLEEYYNGIAKVTLRSNLMETVLEKALGSGLLFWESPDAPPLSRSRERKLSFEWEKNEDETMVLRPGLEGLDSTPLIFHLEKCWFVSPEHSLIGTVDTGGLDKAHLAQLLLAPSIPKKELQKVSDALVTSLPVPHVPTPVKPKVEIQWIEESPTVCLELKKRELTAPKKSQLAPNPYYLKLRFRYGEHLIDGDPNHPVITQEAQKTKNPKKKAKQAKKKTLIKIRQDREAASKAERALFEAGFEPYAPGGDYCYIPRTLFTNRLDAAWFWHDFFEHRLSGLQEMGMELLFDSDAPLEFNEADAWYAEIDEQSSTDWFSLDVGVRLDGQKLNLLPAIVELVAQLRNVENLEEELRSRKHVLVELEEEGRFLKLPVERVLPILQTLVELYDTAPLNKDGKLEFSKHAGMQFSALLDDPNLKWHGAAHLKKIQKKLKNFSGIKEVSQPRGFEGELRDYQRKGLSWLEFLREYEFGGILADDMGLGKTIQTLAYIEKSRASGRLKEKPALIIAPTSLIGNWQREAALFTPKLKTLVIHGPGRHKEYKKLKKADLIITSYPIVQRDEERFKKHDFYAVILDESQYIKNALSKTSQAIFSLKAKHRLCLTGTPMENHLGELWSMFHFLMPGFLGPRERFRRIFQNPIEKEADASRLHELQRRIRPFLLRRSKEDVLKELPPKTEIIRTVLLEGRQRDLYESIRVAMDSRVRDEIQKKGLARSHIMILDALLKLRQVCCDPGLLRISQGRSVKESAKMDLLKKMLPEMIEEGRRILLFSQFTTMLGIIEAFLKKENIPYVKLTGQTRKRDEVIDRFQSGEVPLFLISLKAGGVGLNLTAADTVIHYDPWWNPAVENQATDRAHRIGQKKKVFVYKLLTKDTVEERILELQERKKDLAAGIYGKAQEKKALALDNEDLNRLLSPIG